MKKMAIGLAVLLIVAVSGFAVYSQSPSMKYGYSYEEMDEQGVNEYKETIEDAFVAYSNALIFTSYRTSSYEISNSDWMRTKSMYHDARLELNHALKGLEVPANLKQDHEAFVELAEESDKIAEMNSQQQLSDIFEKSNILSAELGDLNHLIPED